MFLSRNHLKRAFLKLFRGLYANTIMQFLQQRKQRKLSTLSKRLCLFLQSPLWCRQLRYTRQWHRLLPHDLTAFESWPKSFSVSDIRNIICTFYVANKQVNVSGWVVFHVPHTLGSFSIPSQQKKENPVTSVGIAISSSKHAPINTRFISPCQILMTQSSDQTDIRYSAKILFCV